MKNNHPTALVILDGFGYSAEKKYNAIAYAHMPNFNAWWKQYPHAILAAAGYAVGLPDGMVGNSEVGHFTIGAGRVIEQPMARWLRNIKDNTFIQNVVLQEQFAKLLSVGGALHVIGLLSDAGVHGHETCIKAVIDAAVKAGIKKIIVHAILDGRDVAPQSAHDYMQRLELLTKYYNHGTVIIGSIQGRFYAMDRDNNWDRIEKSYRIMTEVQQDVFDPWEKVLERSYAHGVTDEFVVPAQLSSDAVVHNGDGIIFCNVRPDRARELTAAFTQNEFHHFVTKPLNLIFFITPVDYGNNLNTIALFSRIAVHNTLKDILAEHGKTIFTVAETEKYAHVTYFFRGENEEPVTTENRCMIHSLSAKDYIEYPQMRAAKITQAVVESLHTGAVDFYLINYANADMVGHSGSFGATIQAVEFLDKQLGILYDEIVQKMNGTLYITADHGKAEDMFDEKTGQARTAHTNNPVPFIMVQKGLHGDELELKGLVDVAPFIFQNMGLQIPGEME